MKKIFFDLDGTIFDVSERIYQVYKDILQKYNKKILSKKDYIKLKREKIPIKEILKKTDAQDILFNFKKDWRNKIEDPYYLDLDKISYLERQTLLYLRDNHELILVTMRNYQRRLFEQLRKKNINKVFSEILIQPEGSLRLKWKLKYQLIKEFGKYDKSSIIVGDTETDILAGKNLGIKTVAVVNGMRNRRFLLKYKPDVLISNFSKIKNILNREI